MHILAFSDDIDILDTSEARDYDTDFELITEATTVNMLVNETENENMSAYSLGGPMYSK